MHQFAEQGILLFNEKLSKEYEKVMTDLKTNSNLEEMRQKFDEYALGFPNKYYHGTQIEIMIIFRGKNSFTV